jgi:hypothetical protein
LISCAACLYIPSSLKPEKLNIIIICKLFVLIYSENWFNGNHLWDSITIFLFFPKLHNKINPLFFIGKLDILPLLVHTNCQINIQYWTIDGEYRINMMRLRHGEKGEL